jgi:hypothetical protein
MCRCHYSRWQRHGDPLVTVIAAEGTAAERMWPRVDKTDSCWNWTGAVSTAGYGQIRFGKVLYTHRVSYEALVGPIPDGLELDHLCRNRRCCNPDHLEAVEPAENQRRARMARGYSR